MRGQDRKLLWIADHGGSGCSHAFLGEDNFHISNRSHCCFGQNYVKWKKGKYHSNNNDKIIPVLLIYKLNSNTVTPIVILPNSGKKSQTTILKHYAYSITNSRKSNLLFPCSTWQIHHINCDKRYLSLAYMWMSTNCEYHSRG